MTASGGRCQASAVGGQAPLRVILRVHGERSYGPEIAVDPVRRLISRFGIDVLFSPVRFWVAAAIVLPAGQPVWLPYGDFDFIWSNDGDGGPQDLAGSVTMNICLLRNKLRPLRLDITKRRNGCRRSPYFLLDLAQPESLAA